MREKKGYGGKKRLQKYEYRGMISLVKEKRESFHSAKRTFLPGWFFFFA